MPVHTTPTILALAALTLVACGTASGGGRGLERDPPDRPAELDREDRSPAFTEQNDDTSAPPGLDEPGASAEGDAAPTADAPGDGPPAPAAEPPARRGRADLDPDNDAVIGPPEAIAECEQRLVDAGVTFKPARIGLGRKHDGVYTCGAHQVVRFKRGPGAIRYANAPLLTCDMALAMAELERVAQEEAERNLGSRIVAIDHLGTYNCRKMVNFDMISEHSFANAIDLRRFHLADGRTISVLDHFRPERGEDAPPEAIFLRRLANRLYDEDIFSVVVTPYFDSLHRNHIHVDLARYRVDGSRP